MISNHTQSINHRVLEISAELAEMKRSFFIDGIEHPMSKRVLLESELQNLKFEKFKLNTEERKRSVQINQLKAEILKNKLIELGFPNLIKECQDMAELQIGSINQ